MSQEQMTYQDAYNVLTTQVFAPVFFEKLAQDYGIQVTNENEAVELVQLSSKLEQVEQMQLSKQANDRTSLISSASNALDSLVGQRSQQPGWTDNEVKQAAEQLAANPQLRQASLVYHEALRQLAAQ